MVYTEPMSTITICSSASFYRQAVDVEQQLTDAGYKVILPATARIMQKTGDYDVAHYKTWYDDPSQFHKKADLVRRHFDEVAKGDCTLVLNYQKHGIDNYIGGNVLMEMAIAFYLKKPIYILNGLPEDSSYLEEIQGMEPVLLRGDLTTLLTHT